MTMFRLFLTVQMLVVLKKLYHINEKYYSEHGLFSYNANKENNFSVNITVWSNCMNYMTKGILSDQ